MIGLVWRVPGRLVPGPQIAAREQNCLGSPEDCRNDRDWDFLPFGDKKATAGCERYGGSFVGSGLKNLDHIFLDYYLFTSFPLIC